ncbi:MAG: efflux RND transporter periplasmic adaptor subunit [Alistipes sp.]|nr:efflux RND transporter periplasmic adaptor subunit [Alistipes sp.]
MKKSLMLMIVAATLVGCNSNQEKKTSEATVAEEPKAIAIKACTAESMTVDLKETYTSEILPYKENDITPAAQGLHIDEIKVDVGDRVKAGDVVVTLNRTNLKQLEINLATVQDTYDRMKPVHEAGGVSDQQMIELENTLNLQKEVVDNMRRNSEIKSPISGVVTARNFENGDLFASMPILHIMQIDKLKVMANVSEQYYPNVKVGQSVDITVDIFPGETFEGKVTRINPALDAATRTFGVEITIPNKNERLRPGMYARATFNMGKRNGVMVDDVAVQKQIGSSERYVYVIKDGVAEFRLIRDGRRVGSKIDIVEGLEAGEKVATTSFMRLSNGAKVEIINE